MGRGATLHGTFSIPSHYKYVFIVTIIIILYLLLLLLLLFKMLSNLILNFSIRLDISPYRELLDDSRWNALIEEFRLDNFRLYQLGPQSVLAVALQAGLSAMKTP